MKSLADIEALENPEIKEVAMKQYDLCFRNFVDDPEEDLTMDHMGHLVYMESSGELTQDYPEVELLKESGHMLNLAQFPSGTEFVRWEYAERSGNIWQVLVLVNDGFGRIFLFSDDLEMPPELRSELDEWDAA